MFSESFILLSQYVVTIVYQYLGDNILKRKMSTHVVSLSNLRTTANFMSRLIHFTLLLL